MVGSIPSPGPSALGRELICGASEGFADWLRPVSREPWQKNLGCRSAEVPWLWTQEPRLLVYSRLPVTGCGQYINTRPSGLPSVNICINTCQSGKQTSPLVSFSCRI